MREYVVTPSKGYEFSETISAKSPKEAVEIYVKKHNIKYNKILKVTRKVIEQYNINAFNVNEFIDFAVTGDVALNSGGMYKLM